jgi:hypothetical protein
MEEKSARTSTEVPGGRGPAERVEVHEDDGGMGDGEDEKERTESSPKGRREGAAAMRRLESSTRRGAEETSWMRAKRPQGEGSCERGQDDEGDRGS